MKKLFKTRFLRIAFEMVIGNVAEQMERVHKSNLVWLHKTCWEKDHKKIDDFYRDEVEKSRKYHTNETYCAEYAKRVCFEIFGR